MPNLQISDRKRYAPPRRPHICFLLHPSVTPSRNRPQKAHGYSGTYDNLPAAAGIIDDSDVPSGAAPGSSLTATKMVEKMLRELPMLLLGKNVHDDDELLFAKRKDGTLFDDWPGENDGDEEPIVPPCEKRHKQVLPGTFIQFFLRHSTTLSFWKYSLAVISGRRAY